MEAPKFELGPLQKQWIQALRDHPERKMIGRLGQLVSEDSYKACCLGEGGKIAGVCEFDRGILVAKGGGHYLLTHDAYKALGLFDPNGCRKDCLGLATTSDYICLANMNDDPNTTWPQIADELERNPENWFTEPK